MFRFGSSNAAPAVRRRSGLSGRVVIAGIVALVAIIGYFGNSVVNPVTGKKQHISITPQQEIALGLQAAPEMAQQFGGLAPNPEEQALVDRIGRHIVSNIKGQEPAYPFDFHVLADSKTINAFALPGGQIFITEGLLKRLETEGQIAGVLGHEIGHVVGRHSAEQMAKTQLTQGLTGAAVLATYDPNNPSSRNSAAVAAMIGQLVNLRFSREHELDADNLGVRFIADSGYDPHAMIRVMEILQSASEGRSQPEFFATHPNPERRIERIKEAIDREFPKGLPPNLKP
jgi:beta-barrel assembly-enhancing protease